MFNSLITFLGGVISAAKAMNWFADLQKKTKGEIRELVDELKENSRLCFRVVEDKAALEKVIPRFSTAAFDRLNKSGFDFDSVKRSVLPAYSGIETTDLSSWPGKRTSELVETIYDKIKDIRSKQLLVPADPYRRRRIINIHKRILLLLRHAKS